MTPTPRRLTAPDGVSLAVYEAGDRGAPTVVAVHGYPDNHSVWDGVADMLAPRFHVVTYDVRGAGSSDKPSPVSAYRMEHLTADLVTVLDAVSPEEPVHLVAHDWGSIQSWAALTDPRTAGRIASFTSISGPSLDYSGVWLRQVRRHPLASLNQLRHSYYIAVFQLPGLPERAIRSGVLDRLLARTQRGAGRAAATMGSIERPEADKINGLSLYRANMIARLSRPNPIPTKIPVQVIVPDADAFVTTDLAIEAAKAWVENLSTATVPGGHWVLSEQPQVIVELVLGHIDSVDRSTTAGARR
ncbi:MAG: alpha/beta fold hydrolase [Jatrophihabitans sp.]